MKDKSIYVNGVEFNIKKVVNHGEVCYEVYRDETFLFSEDNRTMIRKELEDNFNN